MDSIPISFATRRRTRRRRKDAVSRRTTSLAGWSLAGWVMAAGLTAAAIHLCRAAVPPATPIDAALPFIAVVLALVGWAAHSSLFASVPLLLAGMVALPDERVRLLFYGLVLAVTFVAAIHRLPRESHGDVADTLQPYVLAAAAIMLLRWIPLAEVLWFRELLLLALALGIVAALRATPIAIAAAVFVALVTPAVPLKSAGFALASLIAAMLLRMFGFPRITWRLLPSLVIAVPLFFFAWSGIVARAFPLLLRTYQPPARRELVNVPALPPNQGADFYVPEGARALIVSGANVPRRRPPAVIGRLEPGSVPITIGDVADWGYMRREHWYRSRNTIPRNSAGTVHGYGYAAWIDGAGRIPLPEGASFITVIADPAIPRDAALQVEAFEMEPR